MRNSDCSSDVCSSDLLVGSGTFWLSPTPDVPSKGWDAALPRIATWARLRDRTADRDLLVVNTPFDHVGEVAREESARQLRRWIDGERKPGETGTETSGVGEEGVRTGSSLGVDW